MLTGLWSVVDSYTISAALPSVLSWTVKSLYTQGSCQGPA